MEQDEAILGLIANLWASAVAAKAENAQLRAELAAKTARKPAAAKKPGARRGTK